RDDRRMDGDGKILLQAAHGETATDEFRDAPMRQEGDLQHAVGKAEPACGCTKVLFHLRLAMRERDETSVEALAFESPQGGEEGKGSLAVSELAVDAEVRSAAGDIAPHQRRSNGIGLHLLPH